MASTAFKPRIAVIPGAMFDPAVVDKIARRANYSAWVQLGLGAGPSLDLAVWPTPAAARRAVESYQAGGPDTLFAYSHVALRRVERIENVTLAWYNRPTPTDETLVRRSLRFQPGRGDDHEFTGIWAIRGAFINPQSTAAVNEASFSAAVSPAGACVGKISQSTVEVAVWPSQAAASSHVRYMNEGPRIAPEEMERIRNATLRWFCRPPKADEDAVRNALH